MQHETRHHMVSGHHEGHGCLVVSPQGHRQRPVSWALGRLGRGWGRSWVGGVDLAEHGADDALWSHGPSACSSIQSLSKAYTARATHPNSCSAADVAAGRSQSNAETVVCR